MNNRPKHGFSTTSIHGGIDWKNIYPYAINAPVYTTSTFAFPNQEYGEKLFSGEKEGYFYSRIGNPTVRDVELKLAALEGGSDCIVMNSGMAAITTFVFSVVKKGEHIVAEKSLYGGTLLFFAQKIEQHGIDVTFVDASNPENIRNAIRSNTKLIYVESPSNPNLKLVPIKEVATVGKEFNIVTAIDNTFMSPVLCRPLELGIEVVLHSATKYLNGQSDLIAGAVVSTSDEIIENLREMLVHHSSVLGAFEAYLLGRGLKTLKLRVKEHDKNAMKLAKYLEIHPAVKKTIYPGLESHSQHELAKEQQDGFGSMICFELHGDLKTTRKFVDELKLVTRAVSLGGVASLISHPASSTHFFAGPEVRKDAGISDTYIRFSVGIEDSEDIIADFEQAFAILSTTSQKEVELEKQSEPELSMPTSSLH